MSNFFLKTLLGPFFNIWQLFNMKLFNGIHYNKKDAYWLRFLQIPKNRSSSDLKIDGYSNENIIKFWNKSNFLQNYFLKTLCVMGAITMSLACSSYLYASRKNYYHLHSPDLFWTIAIANYCSLLFIGIFDFTSSIGLILFLYLICKFLKDRFDHIRIVFEQLAIKKKLDLEFVDKNVYRFNLIVDDLQRCDVFWSKFNFLNYNFALILCSVLLLVCKFILYLKTLTFF